MASKEVQKLLLNFNSLKVEGNTDRVKCSYTGHEMKCSVVAINSYINGKKFKKAAAKNSCQLLEKYKEHIEPTFNVRRRNQLFCKTTWRHLNNDPSHIEKHVNGKRFQKALKHFEDCKLKGVEFKTLSGLYGMKRDKSEGVEKTYSKTAADSESGEESEADNDDLTDLYPDEDEGEEEGEGEGEMSNTDDSDFEFEDLEAKIKMEDDSKPVLQKPVKPAKRKLQPSNGGPPPSKQAKEGAKVGATTRSNKKVAAPGKDNPQAKRTMPHRILRKKILKAKLRSSKKAKK